MWSKYLEKFFVVVEERSKMKNTPQKWLRSLNKAEKNPKKILLSNENYAKQIIVNGC